jgi:hypothetical protein
MDGNGNDNNEDENSINTQLLQEIDPISYSILLDFEARLISMITKECQTILDASQL